MWIALRYLLARRSALSYVSRLALLGLVLSVAVLVVVLSVVNGFEKELRERVMGVLPHIVAQGYATLAPQVAEHMVEQARQGGYPGLTALSPYVSGTALLAANGQIHGASLTGINPDSYTQVTDLAKYTTRGGLAHLSETRYGIILGVRLARLLQLQIGDDVLVVLPVGSVTPAGAIPRQRRFKLVDTFDSQSQLDSQTALVDLVSAQRLFRTGDNVHGVQGRLIDLFEIDQARAALYNAAGEDRVAVRSWMSSQGNLYQAIAVQKLTMFVLLSFLVAVAAFNLISGLMMIVEQRKNDVAVLRTLGALSSVVIVLFCTLGMLLAGLGIILGVAVGVLVALGLPVAFTVLNDTFGLNLMSQYFIAYLPVDVRGADILQIAIASSVLALLATLYPAWQAARLLPSRVLAHE